MTRAEFIQRAMLAKYPQDAQAVEVLAKAVNAIAPFDEPRTAGMTPEAAYAHGRRIAIGDATNAIRVAVKPCDARTACLAAIEELDE